jgi:hypothetical protein
MFNSEIKNRILVSVAAYAYEYLNSPIMSDADFDTLAQQIDVTQDTGNKKLDDFFKNNFNADTGLWIHKHPEKSKLKYLYEEYYKCQ